MRSTMILGLLMAAALLVLAMPAGTSAQIYRDRYYDYNYRDQYNDNFALRNALARLDNSTAQLQNDLRFGSQRTVFGILQFRTVDTSAIAQVTDFRRAVRQLRNSSYNGRDLENSVEDAQMVLDQGIQLDRYLRLRSGSTTVDADLSEIRSSLHVIADAYDLSMRY